MGLKIGSVFLELLADGARLGPMVQAEAQKAGDAGAQTLGQRISAGFRTEAPRAFGMVAAAAFGMASKGALELENIQVDLQRETGLTAEAARDASKAINDIAGRNVTPLGDVADAFAKVHNDMGLVGDEANALTERFVKFGRATKQGPADAVSAFDDILDAWNLTADKSGGIMDKLVVSHQRYGGVVADSQAALAEMAPAMQAANMSIDDGIALLNLFNASGVDASKAPTMLAKAVKALKPGQDLDDLIAQIGAIEDPTLKAQKAMEIFGAKAGIGMAHAIQPGMTSLDDFAISAEDAADATSKAADVLDTSLSGRVRKAFSEAGAALRGFGADFGPALTGMASFSTLAASVFPGVGAKIAKGLGGGLLSTLKKVFVPAVATSVASGVADGVAEGASAGATKAASSSAVSGAAGRLGNVLGSGVGKAFALAFGVAVAAIVTADYINAQASNVDLINAITRNAEKASLDAMVGMRGRLAAALAAEQGRFDPIEDFFGLSQQNNLQKQLDALDSMIAQRSGMTVQQLADAFALGQPIVVNATQEIVDGVASTFDRGGRTIAQAATTMMHPIPQAVADAKEAAEAGARQLPGDIASAIRNKRSAITSAFDQLVDDLKNAMSKGKERAKLLSMLTGEEIAKGLKSKDPEVKAQAEHTRDLIEARLAELPISSEKEGRKAIDKLRAGLKSKDPAVRAQAERTKALIEQQIEAIKAREAGQQAGAKIATGLNDKKTTIGSAIYNIGLQIARNFLAGVQGGTGTGGSKTEHQKRAGGGPVTAGQPYIVGEQGWEVVVPDVNSHVLSHSKSVEFMSSREATGGGDTYHFNITNPEPRAAEDDIGRMMRRTAALGLR